MKPYLLSASSINSKFVSSNNLYKPNYTLVRNDPVVTSGIAIFHDFGNPFSYNGTGSTVKDMGSGSYNGSLSGSYTYSSTYGGYMSLSTSGEVATSYTTQACSNSSLQTICAWMIGTSGVFSASTAAGTGQHHFGMAYSSGGTVSHYVSYYGGGSESQADATGITINSTANFICAVKTAAYYYDIYFNGVRVIQNSYKVASSSTTFYPGRYYSGSYPRPQDFAAYMTYDRALSASEILQNYNAMKYRFNL